MPFLESVKTPKDVKKLNIKDLPALADEIREKIISVVSENGGHLASSLGAVDLIVALYYVFDFDNDKLIFDVGHQAYAHKILSGRCDNFDTLRKQGGLSGFPSITESEYDAYSSGHAGSAVSAGLGYAYARDLLKQDNFVISVVGDASLFNGLSMEAMTCDEVKPNKFLVVLNDNGMSISKNNSGLYKLISKWTTKKHYSKTMSALNRSIGKLWIGKKLKQFKAFIKRSLNSNTFIDVIGFNYVGVFDGHDIKSMVSILKNIKDNPRPTLLHLKTIKGKGMGEAEKHADAYHGVGKHLSASENTFSDKLGETLCGIAEKRNDVVAITAGMKDGTGLKTFAEKYPDKFFDVGINEEHAVTLSAGMALGGLKPVVCIYSTFLQRAYDEVLIDVCMQNLPVVFCIDRAGFVGSDGQTHQGLFDLSYLQSMPNLTIITPKDSKEFENALTFAVDQKTPIAIRYPNGAYVDFENHTQFSCGWEIIKYGKNVKILAVGQRMLNLATSIEKLCKEDVEIINVRCVKPLDYKYLSTVKKGDTVITLEENNLCGGFGSMVSVALINENVKFYSFGCDDVFVSHATVNEQLVSCGLSENDVISKCGLKIKKLS